MDNLSRTKTVLANLSVRLDFFENNVQILLKPVLTTKINVSLYFLYFLQSENSLVFLISEFEKRNRVSIFEREFDTMGGQSARPERKGSRGSANESAPFSSSTPIDTPTQSQQNYDASAKITEMQKRQIWTWPHVLDRNFEIIFTEYYFLELKLNYC